MDDAEKRRLKKRGKQIVEQRSRELRERLAEANPAPVGSDEWARNYKAQTLRERDLRRREPDRIAAADAARDFVIDPSEPPPDFYGGAGWYMECSKCHDLLHTFPKSAVACACGSIKLDATIGQYLFAPEAKPRYVQLIARGEPQPRKWWNFW